MVELYRHPAAPRYPTETIPRGHHALGRRRYALVVPYARFVHRARWKLN